jgi:arabinofuranosyltransferase
MAACHLLPLTPSKVSLAVQISGAILRLADLWIVWQLASLLARRREDSAIASVAPPLAVVWSAFFYPLNYWTLMGMEVGAVSLLMNSAVLLAIQDARRGRVSWAPHGLLGVATLVRLDAAAAMLVIEGYLFATSPREQRWKHFAWGAGIGALCLGGQTLFRIAYYGDPLPNTYYLKMTGYPTLPRMLQGARTLGGFAWRFSLPLLALALGALAWRRREERRELWPLAALFGAQAAYSVHTGGDAWETIFAANRFVSTALPALFVLLALSVDDILIFARERAEEPWRSRLERQGMRWAMAFGVLCLFHWNGWPTFQTLSESLLAHPPHNVEENKRHTERGLMIKALTNEDASFAVCWAGALPYFAGDRPAVDLLGKNDPVIARQSAQISLAWSDFVYYSPGHVKWDVDYSFRKLRPDAVLQLWVNGSYRRQAVQAMEEIGYATVPIDHYEPILLRKDSQAVRWNLFQKGESIQPGSGIGPNLEPKVALPGRQIPPRPAQR